MQKRVAEAVGIPADNVRICATHTHSSPTFLYLRQWAPCRSSTWPPRPTILSKRSPPPKTTSRPPDLYVGKSRAEGGNFNRTTTAFKTDKDFSADSTDAERWLDTTVHVLRFERSGKPDVLWYHFSAHPVCYTDGLAGPDWVGGAAELIRDKHRVVPAFLQGHAGDVNPGDGNPWLGDPGRTAAAVAAAVDRAIGNSAEHAVKEMRLARTTFQAPLDIELLKSSSSAIAPSLRNALPANGSTQVSPRRGTKAPGSGISSRRPPRRLCRRCCWATSGCCSTPVSCTAIMVSISAAAPMEHLLVVGYTDGVIGYLTDPKAYRSRRVRGDHRAPYRGLASFHAPGRATTRHRLQDIAEATHGAAGLTGPFEPVEEPIVSRATVCGPR